MSDPRPDLEADLDVALALADRADAIAGLDAFAGIPCRRRRFPTQT